MSREFENGDSPIQLLARSRYILTIKTYEWTYNQRLRAEILFKNYPSLKVAYDHVIEFRNIYENKFKNIAKQDFETWINKTLDLNIEEFNIITFSIEYHSQNILIFFNNRNTNANAESFNSKIKLFRADLRGVTDTKFFLFRLHKLFA